ncbi:MAG: 3-hydroxyacyl-CoA dehydrogenase/enoyl-CoA hydratase family protein [Bacteroidales bacterium]|nr:3-hydroxyacyl-CoA dehydrogenase/enoyl-CoA hydratase family protein [Bacteroidales bacterium]
MRSKHINKVAVLGSGIMGSAIACHFANAGKEVLLLDLPTKDSKTDDSISDRNKFVNTSLQNCIKSKPSPLYHSSFAKRITTGNFDDDLNKITEVDWIIEVIIERIDIKQQLFEKIEKYRTPGTIISSNTSGIPIHLLSEGRTEDFKENFCGTHFFNPPRYLQLFEIIPTPDTNPELLRFLMDFGARHLGKVPVECKDTPAFIANRIGVFAILSVLQVAEELGLTVDEVDRLTGPIIGKPKSATFRTSDVVGLDTLVHVVKNLQKALPEEAEYFNLPAYIEKMLEQNMLGEKTKQGFYKKVKDENGKSNILSLDLLDFEYKPKKRVKFPAIDAAKTMDDLSEKLKFLIKQKDISGEFYRKTFYKLLAYVSLKIPEISDDIYKIDAAVKAGFGWKQGPFESWDALGGTTIIDFIEKEGVQTAEWIKEMRKNEHHHFYKRLNGQAYYYDIKTTNYKPIPGMDDYLLLSELPNEALIWKNNGANIYHLGDDVLCLEFTSKMNTIGADVLNGINKAIDLAENQYKALVIYNEGDLFSAGADVGMIFMYAAEQELDELNFAVQYFQKTMMRLRYSSIPVIAAPHQVTLGGGVELCMHCDKVIAHAETYMGLVEFGVGIIPSGGGTKEFALRLSDELINNDVRTHAFMKRFLTIGKAEVSTSAYEAFDLGYLRKGIDEIIIERSRQLSYSKQVALTMIEKGYQKPIPRTDIKVMGQEGLAIALIGADSYMVGKYMSEHDKLIAQKLGYALCGGDLTLPLTEVSEEYLLELERQAFLELCMKPKTLERIQSLIKTGKILRN